VQALWRRRGGHGLWTKQGPGRTDRTQARDLQTHPYDILVNEWLFAGRNISSSTEHIFASPPVIRRHKQLTPFDFIEACAYIATSCPTH